MALCNVSIVGEDGGYEMTCCDEHHYSDDPLFACYTFMTIGAAVPNDKRVKPKGTSQRRAKKICEKVVFSH